MIKLVLLQLNAHLFTTTKSLLHKMDLPHFLAEMDTNIVVYSFQEICLNWEVKIEAVDATSRLIFPFANDTLALFYFIESDSSVSSLLLWDLLHSMPVGTKIISIEKATIDTVFKKKHYLGFIELKSEQSYSQAIIIRHYVKQRMSAVELESGLEDWSFGIPSGPGDATPLNACVRRILELKAENLEIILCGEPGQNFRYRKAVRIIGQDIPFPPLNIALKKNRLVEHASNPNVCLLHDTVILPRDFLQAMARFGDTFPFTGFQSIYALDKGCFALQRYADYATCLDNRQAKICGVIPSSNLPPQHSFIADSVYLQPDLPWISPLYYDPSCYLTGRLYVFKKSLWKECPQNESILWGKFEDVEHGDRAFQEHGIPMRVNTYSVTQNIIARDALCPPLVYRAGIAAKQQKFRPPLRFFALGEYKPIFPFSENEYRRRICDGFISRFVNPSIIPQLTNEAMLCRLNTIGRIWLASRILSHVVIPRNRLWVESLIDCFSTFLVGETAMSPWRSELLRHFLEDDSPDTQALLWEWNFSRQIRRSLAAPLCATGWKDFFHKNPKSKLGILLAMFLTNWWYPHYFHHPDGLRALVDSFLNALPTVDYCEE